MAEHDTQEKISLQAHHVRRAWMLMGSVGAVVLLGGGLAVRFAMIAGPAYLPEIVGGYVLLAMGLIAAMRAIWQHATTAKSLESAQQAETAVRSMEDQQELLRLVADQHAKAIVIVNSAGTILFANQGTARRANCDVDEIVGKPLWAVMGHEQANRYLERARSALEAGAPVVAVDRRGGHVPLISQIQHVPLPERIGQVLIVEEDITMPIMERERRERTLRQVVDTLVAMVDRRDPYAANHSLQVGKVARAIAAEMGLEPSLVDAAEMAGQLMNLGKILVPSEVLTRPGPLSADELKMVRKSLRTSAELLSRIEFDGPVSETLLQCNERYDGTGWPDGWRGEDILITARILAVANTFVALVNARAHRPGLEIDQALETLMSQIGSAYDRRVVGALVNYIDNHGGRAEWSKPVTAMV